MIELYLIGYTEDREHLVLDFEVDGEGRYSVRIDPDLLATVEQLRGDRTARGLPVDLRRTTETREPSAVPEDRDPTDPRGTPAIPPPLPPHRRRGVAIAGADAGNGQPSRRSAARAAVPDRGDGGPSSGRGAGTRGRRGVVAAPPSARDEPDEDVLDVEETDVPDAVADGTRTDADLEVVLETDGADEGDDEDELDAAAVEEDPTHRWRAPESDDDLAEVEVEDPEDPEEASDALAFDPSEWSEPRSKYRPAAGAVPRAALSPAEIQARLRAGRSPRAVAKEAGADLAWIERWLTPIVAERERVLAEARRRRLAVPRARALGAAVDRALTERRVDPASASWSVSRRADGRWRVTVRFEERRKTRTATWLFDPEAERLQAASELATALASPPKPRKRR